MIVAAPIHMSRKVRENSLSNQWQYLSFWMHTYLHAFLYSVYLAFQPRGQCTYLTCNIRISLKQILVVFGSFGNEPERGYNPETPSNFPYHSKLVLIRWHAHPGYDWWRLPSGEAALVSPLWQAPSNSSLDWASVGVTLGPDSELSVWVLVAQCWGITLGQGSWHLSHRDSPWKSPGGRPILRMTGGWGSGIWRSRTTQDESRGKAYVKDDRRLGLRCIDLGWSVSRDAGPR